MNTTATFVLGLLIGWLAEWALDWFYWRRRAQASALPAAKSKPAASTPAKKSRTTKTARSGRSRK